MGFTAWNKYEIKSTKSSRRADIRLLANGKYEILIWNGSSANLNNSTTYTRSFLGAKLKIQHLFRKLERHDARRRKAFRNKPVAVISNSSKSA